MSFYYIVIDGIDGVGKTTQIQNLVKRFQSAGFHVIQVREPGGTDIGVKIRSILLDKSNDAISPSAELLLFFADRAQLHHEMIAECNQADVGSNPVVIISDRGIPSTYAYQYHQNKFDIKLMQSLEDFSGMLHPDLVLILDLEESIALDRAISRLQQPRAGSDSDTSVEGSESGTLMEKEGRFESNGLEYYRNIREGFGEYRKHNNDKVDVRIVDAQGSPSEVYARLWSEVERTELWQNRSID